MSINGWVWIDAICIDQNNAEEKSAQIPLMTTTFSSAFMVIVWLGEPQEHVFAVEEMMKWLDMRRQMPIMAATTAEDVLKTVEEGIKGLGMRVRDISSWEASEDVRRAPAGLRTEYRRALDALRSSYGIMEQQAIALESLVNRLLELHPGNAIVRLDNVHAAVNSALKSELFPPDHWFWQAFLEYMNNDWFSRVWTQQEVLLAKQVGVLCSWGGFHYAILDDCRKTLFRMNTTGPVWSRKFVCNLQYTGHEIDRLQEMLYVLPVTKLLNDPGSLSWSMLNTRHLRATVAKDHIYGMLGMVDETTRSLVPIEYKDSDAHVFAAATKQAVRTSRWPATLPRLWETYDRVPSALENLPSWCPDFSNTINLLLKPGVEWQISLAATDRYADMARIDLSSKTWGTIGCKGLRLEVVERHDNSKIMLDTADIARIRQTPDTHKQCEEILKIFDRSEIRQWLEAVKADLPWRNTSRRSGRALDWAYMLSEMLHKEGPDLILKRSEMIAEFTGEAFEVLVRQRGKYIFETASGRLGFSYKPLTVGDQTVLVPGGWHLHVVSANGQRYIGCAYMEDYADDEFLHSQVATAGEWEMFYLS